MVSQVPQQEEFYRQMLRIRLFEETVLELFPRGVIYGTTHTYIGQEANAVGVLSWLEDGDVVVSNHRCHGHFLAYGGSMHALAAELMGRSTGVCGGRGGSQHVKWKDFYANGILGGTIPLAVGIAFAEMVKGNGKIVFAFMGDGTLGEGVVYESLNMASLWQLPVLFVLENNRYAQSTPIRMNLAGEISVRFQAFGIQADEIEAADVVSIHELAREAVTSVRGGAGPRAVILHTYRFAPHSKGDDTRDPEEIASFRARDPLRLLGESIPENSRRDIGSRITLEVEQAFKKAESDPMADPHTLTPPLDVA
ncbi:MAG: thiamine pyrophosphate-dependent dehydrogenase E1 component subunit alpha [Anaerolineales bacterium]|nr:thiamine pyrophosphate-dependent dehydrogenase E1 component subunit alpha [Anaerolineales bacterium]